MVAQPQRIALSLLTRLLRACSLLACFAALIVAAGCSLPLTAATAPLAVGYWGMFVGSVVQDMSKPAPDSVLHAEAGPVLTREAVTHGRIDPDGELPADPSAWLSSWGIGGEDIDQGKVILVRIGLYAPGMVQPLRGVFLPVLTTRPRTPGSVVEVTIGHTWPASVVSAAAPDLAAGRCEYRKLPAQSPHTESFYGKTLGHPHLAAALVCPGLQSIDWQRSAIFWHEVFGKNPAASRNTWIDVPRTNEIIPPGLAALKVYRNWSDKMAKVEVPVKLDGADVAKLKNAECMVVLLRPGDHVLTAGRGGVWSGIPSRELSLAVKAGDRIYAEYMIDDHEASNLLQDLTNLQSHQAWVVRFVERSRLTALDGCLGAPEYKVGVPDTAAAPFSAEAR